MRHASNGTRLWSVLHGSSGVDEGIGVAVDFGGAVYIAGFVESRLYGESFDGSRSVYFNLLCCIM
ncbi:hypothetical protein EON65_32150 [archaeon]|nr:MAG: hypothetical protein EON65_32150 [archaeon]